MDNLVQ